MRWLRSQPDQAGLVRDCFYDDPLLEAAQRYHRSTEWAALRRLLPGTPGRALDLGAGRGITSYALAREGWQVTALEPDPSPLVGAGAVRRLAVEAGLPIAVEQGHGEALPFVDGAFDLVVGRAVLHHARDLAALVRAAARVLAPGGLLVACREHVLSRPEDLQAFQAAHPLHHLYGGERAYLLAEYLGALRGAGLEVIRVLNPWASDVNLFPDSQEALRQRLARRLHLPGRAVPRVLLEGLGRMRREPGRLYSFVARRHRG